MTDILIIGSGPAGLSAAINARVRNKTVLVVSNPRTDSGLYKAQSVDNYPGFPGISGAELSGRLFAHAQGMGAETVASRVTNAMRQKNGFSIGYGSEAASGRALILATGSVQTSVFPGETEFLGRGVSYCATCDGMLYRGRRVVVVSLSPEAGEEAEYLRGIGCDVVEVSTENVAIKGENTVASALIDGESVECDAVFILRRSVAPDALLPGLALRDGSIAVDRDMRTNIPGLFAAGDCTGAPRQIAKAVGEGQLAAFSAIKYISEVN